MTAPSPSWWWAAGRPGWRWPGALAELLDVSVRHDGFKFARSRAKIILVDGLDRLLTPFKPSASAYAADTLRRRGVELRLGRMVKQITPAYVELDDGSRIPTRTVVWAGGVTVEGTVASGLGALADRSGRLIVEADLALPGHHQAYAIGDAAAVPWGEGRPGTTCPQLAQVAIQSGKHAAEQIVNRVKGKPTQPFSYNDKGTMATIGRRAAITQFPSGIVIRGHSGLVVLARPPPHLPDRLSQQDHRAGELVVALPVLDVRAPHHRRRRAAGRSHRRRPRPRPAGSSTRDGGHPGLIDFGQSP